MCIKMHRVVFVMFAVLLLPAVFSHLVTVNVNYLDGRPVSGGSMTVYGSDGSVFTVNITDGKASFEEDTGYYLVVIRRRGYPDKPVLMHVQGDVTVNLLLIKNPSPTLYGTVNIPDLDRVVAVRNGIKYSVGQAGSGFYVISVPEKGEYQLMFINGREYAKNVTFSGVKMVNISFNMTGIEVRTTHNETEVLVNKTDNLNKTGVNKSQGSNKTETVTNKTLTFVVTGEREHGGPNMIQEVGLILLFVGIGLLILTLVFRRVRR